MTFLHYSILKDVVANIEIVSCDFLLRNITTFTVREKRQKKSFSFFVLNSRRFKQFFFLLLIKFSWIRCTSLVLMSRSIRSGYAWVIWEIVTIQHFSRVHISSYILPSFVIKLYTERRTLFLGWFIQKNYYLESRFLFSLFHSLLYFSLE